MAQLAVCAGSEGKDSSISSQYGSVIQTATDVSHSLETETF